MSETSQPTRFWRSFLARMTPGLVGLVVSSLSLEPSRGQMGLGLTQNGPLERVQVLGSALLSYATDHDGAYPTGKSSTEIFQQLIDQKYITDPSVVWFALPGKTKPASMTLKPENVCWDVTVPVDGNAPDALPVVFCTGYKLTYAAAGTATPLFPVSDNRPRGIAVSYHSQRAVFLRETSATDRTVNNVIPGSFDAGGKQYQQLTPDGPLAP